MIATVARALLQLQFYSKTQQNPQLSCHFLHHSCSYLSKIHSSSVYRNVFNTKVKEMFDFKIVLVIHHRARNTSLHTLSCQTGFQTSYVVKILGSHSSVTLVTSSHQSIDQSRTGFSKTWGLLASVSFPPLPLPLIPAFCTLDLGFARPKRNFRIKNNIFAL